MISQPHSGQTGVRCRLKASANPTMMSGLSPSPGATTPAKWHRQKTKDGFSCARAANSQLVYLENWLLVSAIVALIQVKGFICFNLLVRFNYMYDSKRQPS